MEDATRRRETDAGFLNAFQSQARKDVMNIGFPLFANLTQLDLAGPWEVLTRIPGAKCHLIADRIEPVASANGGLAIMTMHTFESAPQLDLLCVPGGPGHLAAMTDERLLNFVSQQAQSCAYVTSVCTGAMVLAAAGLLRGYRATTHWMSLDRLAQFGATPLEERVVIDRNRITGGGVTAGIDFGLMVLAEIAGEKLARECALQLEYAPAPPFDGSPRTADPTLLDASRQKAAGYFARMREADERALARLRSQPKTT